MKIDEITKELATPDCGPTEKVTHRVAQFIDEDLEGI